MNHANTPIAQFLDAVNAMKGNEEPFTRVIPVDSHLAQYLLSDEVNPGSENRVIAEPTVRAYAKDMLAGKWQSMNGQQIVISKEGLLNDGQHRCSAIFDSGVVVPMQFLFGAERDSRLTIDQGKARTSAAYLKMTGIANSSRVSSIANWMNAYETGRLVLSVKRNVNRDGTRTTKTELFEYTMKRLPLIERAHDFVVANNGSTNTGVAPVAQLAAVLAVLIAHSGSTQSDVENFFAKIITGVSLNSDDPAYRVRERMLQLRLQEKKGPMGKMTIPVVLTFEIIIRGWNAHRLGRGMNKGITIKGEIPSLR